MRQFLTLLHFRHVCLSFISFQPAGDLH